VGIHPAHDGDQPLDRDPRSSINFVELGGWAKAHA